MTVRDAQRKKPELEDAISSIANLKIEVQEARDVASRYISANFDEDPEAGHLYELKKDARVFVDFCKKFISLINVNLEKKIGLFNTVNSISSADENAVYWKELFREVKEDIELSRELDSLSDKYIALHNKMYSIPSTGKIEGTFQEKWNCLKKLTTGTSNMPHAQIDQWMIDERKKKRLYLEYFLELLPPPYRGKLIGLMPEEGDIKVSNDNRRYYVNSPHVEGNNYGQIIVDSTFLDSLNKKTNESEAKKDLDGLVKVLEDVLQKASPGNQEKIRELSEVFHDLDVNDEEKKETFFRKSANILASVLKKFDNCLAVAEKCKNVYKKIDDLLGGDGKLFDVAVGILGKAILL